MHRLLVTANIVPISVTGRSTPGTSAQYLSCKQIHDEWKYRKENLPAVTAILKNAVFLEPTFQKNLLSII
jgi:hypothetical protein